jgi:pyruvate,water dikinase
MTKATRELVIDAAWGLGEGVVSGIVTPDQLTLDHNLKITSRRLGGKLQKVVRDPTTGVGTAVVPVDPVDQAKFTLTDTQLKG